MASGSPLRRVRFETSYLGATQQFCIVQKSELTVTQLKSLVSSAYSVPKPFRMQYRDQKMVLRSVETQEDLCEAFGQADFLRMAPYFCITPNEAKSPNIKCEIDEEFVVMTADTPVRTQPLWDDWQKVTRADAERGCWEHVLTQSLGLPKDDGSAGAETADADPPDSKAEPADAGPKIRQSAESNTYLSESAATSSSKESNQGDGSLVVIEKGVPPEQRAADAKRSISCRR